MPAQLVPWIRLAVRLVISAPCATAFLGCRTSPPPVDTRLVIPRETVTTVLVRNHSGADLRIWIVGGNGASHRMGFVPKLGSATLVVPRPVVLPATVLFVAIPMSADEPQTSSPVTVERGARLVFTVAHDVSLSTLARLP